MRDGEWGITVICGEVEVGNVDKVTAANCQSTSVSPKS